MEQFQKKARMMHVKSVESIMLRNALHLNNSNLSQSNINKSYRITKLGSSINHNLDRNSTVIVNEQRALKNSRLANQSTAVKTLKLSICNNYLKRYEMQKENVNLAKRIAESSPTINSSKQYEEWKTLKSYFKVRCNFKKNIDVCEPRIFKIERMIGFGNNSYRLLITQLCMEKCLENPTYVYYLIFKIAKRKFKSRILSYSALLLEQFYINIPRFLENGKTISARIMQIKSTEQFDQGKFKINTGVDEQQTEIYKKNKILNGKLSLSFQKQF